MYNKFPTPQNFPPFFFIFFSSALLCPRVGGSVLVARAGSAGLRRPSCVLMWAGPCWLLVRCPVGRGCGGGRFWRVLVPVECARPVAPSLPFPPVGPLVLS